VLGKGGHGAEPEETVDPTYMAAHVILALNAMISRRISAFDPAIVSIGSIKGGHIENVIPDRVDITGTLRYMEERVQKQLHMEIEQAFALTRAMGGNYELRFEIGTPPMIDHPDAVALIRAAVKALLGEEHILEPEKDLGGEDFGCFTKIAPGAMFMLGARIEGDVRTAHNPHFDINEDCLPIGAAMLAECTLRFLRKKREKNLTFW
jgi:amidohydrolase